MIAIEACEVEVGEYVAQEDQTAEAGRFQQRQGVSRTADIRPKMNI
jgi:hypothetical protein